MEQKFEGSPIQGMAHFLRAGWKFSRPHTIIGTSLSVVCLWLMALPRSPLGLGSALAWPDLGWLGLAWVTCLCGNVYIVGLNQIEDVAIDRINKPQLPLASGEFSLGQAWAIVVTTGVLAILLALGQGVYLLGTVVLSLLIGTAYSLPPLRLKRFAFLASLCIFLVRGVIVNLGLFLHFQQGHRELTPAVLVLTVFVILFTFGIALFKDIPDLEGDRQYQIHTFTVRWGQGAVFNLAFWVLNLAYGGMIIAGLGGIPGVNSGFLVLTHLGLLGLLWRQRRRIDLTPGLAQSPRPTLSYPQFYQFIWKLFFLEYGIFSGACLIASLAP